MEGESRRGRGETRRAGSISNPSFLSHSNPATVTQRNYMTVDVAAATENARTEATLRLPERREEARLSLPERREEFVSNTGELVVPTRIIRRRGRGETRRAGSISNPSSLSLSHARSRSRSRSRNMDVDRSRSRSRSMDNDRRRRTNSSSSSVGGRIISSNHPIDDSDVIPVTARIRTPSSANPATATQRNYMTINVVAATENARREARIRLPERREEARLRLPERREEFASNTGGRVVFTRTIRRGTISDAQSVRGSNRAAVQQLARVIISEKHISNDNNCSICLEEYKLEEAARVMQCGHMYHETCIFTWLESNRTCPFCRFEMP